MAATHAARASLDTGRFSLAPALHGRLADQVSVAPATRDAMFRLLSSHFAGVDRESFDDDLDGKNAVILLEDEDRVLRGFSTLLVYTTRAAGRPMTIVYSGDTIVERASWGSPALARTWIHAVRQLVHEDPDVYWLLLTSGFRTYRFLPVFYKSFHPRVDEPTPAATRTLIDAIAGERFGQCYDSASGIVRFARPQVLAGDLLDVPAGRSVEPHVRFFLERNPGFTNGDELVCLTRIADDNLTPAGRRMARGPERG
jgi:hypothetical protein